MNVKEIIESWAKINAYEIKIHERSEKSWDVTILTNCLIVLKELTELSDALPELFVGILVHADGRLHLHITK